MYSAHLYIRVVQIVVVFVNTRTTHAHYVRDLWNYIILLFLKWSENQKRGGNTRMKINKQLSKVDDKF